MSTEINNTLPTGWQLINGVERNKKAPATFKIPYGEVRHYIRPGENVKLGFELIVPDASSGFTGERMWIRVDVVYLAPTTTGEVKRYRGTLLNTSIYDAELLRAGLLIEFGPEHILATEF